MKNKVIPFIIATALLVGSTVQAQEEINPSKDKGFCISISPQHAFVHKLQLGLDLQFGTSSSWLILEPSYISSFNDNLWDLYYDKKVGGGLTASHRYFVSNSLKPKGVYVQYGVVYNYSHLTHQGDTWVPVDFNGTDAITMGETTIKDNIHQYGFDLLIGYQTIKSEKLLLDFYLGVGHRNSTTKSSSPESRNNDGSAYGILAPNYMGMLPLAGIRIGICF